MEKCKVCGLSKSESKTGSLTQYLTSCSCDSFDVYIPRTYDTCSKCGKRIRKEKSGSITQYIFSASICSCDAPTPSNTLGSGQSNFQSQAFTGFEEGKDEIELEVDGENFPKDRYKPLKLLGAGAGGRVYLSRDKLLKKLVTVKTLAVLTADQLIQFQEEAKATNKLNHGNIVKIIDFGATESGSPYMVLEYFPGVSLEKVLKEHGFFEWDIAVGIAIQVCQALAYTHEQGIYHRDIKPSNILLSSDEEQESEVKLIDFGIAKVAELTMSNLEDQGATMAGTPKYMLPDTSMGNRYNASSEVYSLGCVLFELLTGDPPFSGETSLETISMHVHQDPPSLTDYAELEIPDQLQVIVSKCLSKKQDSRYSSMPELSKALESISIPDQEEPHGESSFNQYSSIGEKQKGDEKLLLTIGGIVLLLAFSGLAYFYLESKLNPQNPAVTKHKSDKDDFDGKIAMNSEYQKSLDKVYMKHNNKGGPFDYVITGYLEGNDKLLKKTIESHKGRIDSLEFLADDLKGNALSYVSTLPLFGLNLLDCEIDAKTLELIGKMKTLKSLRLNECKGLKGKDLKFLQTLPNLIQLNLKRTEVTDAALKNALGLKNLQVLDVSNCPNLKGDFLKELWRLERLHALLIANIKLDNRSIKNLSKMKSLKLIELTDFPENSLRVLSAIKIERIQVVDSTTLDDKLLDALAGIKTVKEIKLERCGLVTDKTIAYLKSEYPQKEIVRTDSSLTRRILETERQRKR